MSKIAQLFENPADAPTYVIAEIGINHDGDAKVARHLMRAAADAGVDAVKFQKRNLHQIYTKSLLEDANTAEWSFQYLLPQLKEIELGEDDYHDLNNYAHELKLEFIVTPFDPESAKFISSLDVAAIKIASADLTNWPLIQQVASMGKPMILSTGMWDDETINAASEFVTEIGVPFAFLHCQSTYPAPVEAINLRYLKKLAGYAPVVGYSGHERGTSVCIAAMGMGAKIVEKHITFNHLELGPDHKASLEPAEFKSLVDEIRSIDLAMGECEKKITQAEILNREVFAKSLTANRELEVGHTLTEKDVILRSPGKGIPPHKLKDYVGRTLKKPKRAEDYISESDFHEVKSLHEWEPFHFSKQWGLKCRFHDFPEYTALDTPVIEFHCSDIDVEGPFNQGNKKSDLVLHAPEIIGKELFDLCTDNPSIVEMSLDILEKTLTKVRQLHNNFSNTRPKVVLHVGGMFLNETSFDVRIMLKRAEKNLANVDFSDVDLLPENLPPRPWYLGGQWFQHAFMTPEDMVHICKALGTGMTLDICHAQLYCHHFEESLKDYIETVLPYVRHLHISDASGIDGEGVQINEGEIDFDSVFRLLEKTKYSWVPEIWSGHTNNGTGNYTALCRLQDYKKIL